MVGLAAYYLLSPFNLILFLFSRNTLPAGITLIIALKIASCGFTFFQYLRATHAVSAKMLLMSTTYALMGYNVAYFLNIMWLDGVIMLPLIAVGIRKIVQGDSGHLYVASLSLSLIINYYIGFMLCLFSGLYFISQMLLLPGREISYAGYGKKVAHFAASSITVIGLSAFILLPVYFSLQGGKAQFSLANLFWKLNFDPGDSIGKLFINTTDFRQLYDGLPPIFCSMLVFALVVLYAGNRRIPFKTRLVNAALLLFVYLCFMISALDLIWHGLNLPTWFPYRYSFIFCFLMIGLAYDGLANIDRYQSPKAFLSTALIVLATGLFVASKHLRFHQTYTLWFDIVLGVVLCGLLYLYKAKPKWRKQTLCLMMLLQVIELSIFAYGSFTSLYQDSNTAMSTYNEVITSSSASIDQVLENDQAFYRIEMDDRWTPNDAMLFNYSGISHFSSSDKQAPKELLGRLGYRNNGNWASYGKGSTSTADCILGIRYLLSYGQKIAKPYTLLYKKDGIYTYQNPDALPLAYWASEDAQYAEPEDVDPFSYQATMIEGIVGESVDDLFVDIPVDNVALTNLTASEQDDGTAYTVINEGTPAAIAYHFKAPSVDPIYMCTSRSDIPGVDLFINGERHGKYDPGAYPAILPIGRYDAGEDITIEFQFKSGAIKIGEMLLRYEDQAIIKTYTRMISEYACKLTKISSSHIVGTAKIPWDNGFIMLTIPYDDAWHITIDGHSVQAVALYDALLAIPVVAGDCAIALQYIPGGLYIGIFVSLFTFMIYILFSTIIAVKKKRKSLRFEHKQR